MKYQFQLNTLSKKGEDMKKIAAILALITLSSCASTKDVKTTKALSDQGDKELFTSSINIEHCNAILEHGINDITTSKSSKHTRVFKWHSNCGSELADSSGSLISSAHGGIFGVGSGSGQYDRSYFLKKIKTWCDQNREFALSNEDLFDEARKVNEPALNAWNQCQIVAKKGVEITFTPHGPHGETVHFTIDSTLDSNLKYLGTVTTGYTCQDIMTKKKDGTPLSATDQPDIRNANIHISCTRDAPEIEVDEVNGVGTIKYEFASISVNTNGPALPVSFHRVVESYNVTPPSTVLAFDLQECPPGWVNYTPAFGRFVRGIDKNKPEDQQRETGSIQAANVGSHDHSYSHMGGAHLTCAKGGGGVCGLQQNQAGYANAQTSNPGGEPRPVNVALLYCRKH